MQFEIIPYQKNYCLFAKIFFTDPYMHCKMTHKIQNIYECPCSTCTNRLSISNSRICRENIMIVLFLCTPSSFQQVNVKTRLYICRCIGSMHLHHLLANIYCLSLMVTFLRLSQYFFLCACGRQKLCLYWLGGRAVPIKAIIGVAFFPFSSSMLYCLQCKPC